MSNPNAVQQLEHQLVVVKAAAFDTEMELKQTRAQLNMSSDFIRKIAEKLGLTPKEGVFKLADVSEKIDDLLSKKKVK